MTITQPVGYYLTMGSTTTATQRNAAAEGLTWDAETGRWMTHRELGATTFQATFPESWGWREMRETFAAEWAAGQRTW